MKLNLFLALIAFSLNIYAFKYKTARGGDLNFPAVNFFFDSMSQFVSILAT